MRPLVTERQFRATYKLQKFADRAISSGRVKFPVYPKPDLAKIASYLTFDGHLTTKGNVFLFTAGKRNQLSNFSNLVRKELCCEGRTKKVQTNLFGTSYEYRVFNKPVCRVLNIIGVPDGNKIITPFEVPDWIVNNEECSKAYLQAAFDCEGSVWKECHRLKVRFKIHKAALFEDNALHFINQLRSMLSVLEVETTQPWSVAGNTRKDGIRTKGYVFSIASDSLQAFRDNVGFKLPEKRKLMGS